MKNNYSNNSKTEKRQKTKSLFIFIISFCLCLAFCLAGLVIKISIAKNITLIWISLILSVFIFSLYGINYLIVKKYTSKINKLNPEEFQNFFLHHRENAEQTTKETLKKLRKFRVLTKVYSIFLLICAFAISFFSCWIPSNSTSFIVPFLLITSYLVSFILLRETKPFTKKDFNEDDSYVSKEDFPALYNLAEKARDTVGCKGEIKIALLADNNAGIAQIDGIFSIQLGGLLLNALDEDEVFAVLLHEFAHILWENQFCKRETEHYTKITRERTNYLSINFRFDKLFSFSDVVYVWNYDIFRYSAALTVETYADSISKKYGSDKIAASALTKINYFAFYEWEMGTYDEKIIYAQSEPPKTFISDFCQKYKDAIAEKSHLWEKYMDVEILSRNASHPTLKMRIESMGVHKVQAISSTSSDEFIADAKKALSHLDTLWLRYNKELFEERRKQYSDAFSVVEKWENDGKPLSMSEYQIIATGLRNIGRVMDALELCERAIQTFDDSQATYANFIKGNHLIHQYDEKGVEYIYKSVENHNFRWEGLDMIGRFFCMTGNQKGLDAYREKSLKYAFDEQDKYANLGNLTKNNISEEKLPDGMLEEILEFISTLDTENVEKIFLVRQKVTDDFFASCFVIMFFGEKCVLDEDVKKNDEFYDRLFVFLDTFSTHQFCLIDYRNVCKLNIEKINNSCVYTSPKLK